MFEFFGRDNLLPIVIVQNVGFFVCVVIVASLARMLGGLPAMMAAALFYLTDFITFYYTNAVLSESLFGLMLCLAVFMIVRAFRGDSISLWSLFWAGLAIVGATYIRIASIYLIQVTAILITAFAYERERQWRLALRAAAVFVAPWIVIGGLWYVRNYVLAGQFVFTTEQLQLFFHRSLNMVAALENVSKTEATPLLAKYLGPQPHSVGTHLVFYWDHLALFVRQVVTDLALTVAGPGQWHVPPYFPEFPLDRKALFPFIDVGNFAGLWRELAGRGFWANFILATLIVHIAALCLGVVAGIAAAMQAWGHHPEMSRLLLATILLLFAYFLGQLVFWEGATRFRFPILPFMAVLAGYGYAVGWAWLCRARRRA